MARCFRPPAPRLRRFVPLFLVFGALLGGCTSTSVLEKWHDTAYTGPPLHRLLIVSVESSDGRRRLFEDGMTGALQRRGIQAEPSYRLLPDALPERGTLSEAAQREGYDGVLMLHPMGTTTRSSYSPGSMQYYPTLRPTLDGKYTEYWHAVYQPGFSALEQAIDYQTDVFATATGRLVWSAATRSLDLSSAQSITIDIAGRIVPDLRQSGLVGNAPR